MRSIIILALVSIAVCSSDLKNSYDHFASLDEKGDYLMYWTIVEATQMINISIVVKTTGWVGFGISPYTGRMPGSDVVIGWVDSKGKAFLKDRYATGHDVPVLDEQQDYTLISGEEVNGKTILKFKRKINTGDSKDLPIEGGTTRLIWSYHFLDPVSSEKFTKHDKQGTRSLNLLNAVPEQDKPPLPSDTKHFDIISHNVSVPSIKTTYWCSAFKLPIFNTSFHVIKVSPVIQKGNEGLVHHIQMYDCTFEDELHGENHDCDSQNMPDGLSWCRGATLLAAWAVGGEDITLPAHVGMPIGNGTGTRYVLMEVHYDNPNQLSGLRDSSGMRFYYTSQKRKYEAAILTIGRSVSPLTLIPEGQKNWEVASYCSSHCTEKNLPSTGIHLLANMLHTHLAGVRMSIRHFRKDKELPLLAHNPHYDFNYQELMYLKKEVTVFPGDQLSLTCTYNTENRKNVTVGGISTKDEMCLGFILYYPKQKLAACKSYEAYQAYLSYFNALRAAGQTPPFNDYPSKPPYFWQILNETRIGNGKYLRMLAELENKISPLQVCVARDYVNLVEKDPLEITKFTRIPTNTYLENAAKANSYSYGLFFSFLLIMQIMI